MILNQDFVVEACLNAILDKVYPVGSVYISVVNNSPENFIGGTWEFISQGKTLVGVDTNDVDFDTPEETGGSKTKTLETANLPSHTHTISHTHTHSHTHTRGTQEIYGYIQATGNGSVPSNISISSCGGAFAAKARSGWKDGYTQGSNSNTTYYADFYASRYWTGSSSDASTTTTSGASSTDSGGTGSGAAVNVMNPYFTVYMWKRTA